MKFIFIAIEVFEVNAFGKAQLLFVFLLISTGFYGKGSLRIISSVTCLIRVGAEFAIVKVLS